MRTIVFFQRAGCGARGAPCMSQVSGNRLLLFAAAMLSAVPALASSHGAAPVRSTPTTATSEAPPPVDLGEIAMIDYGDVATRFAKKVELGVDPDFRITQFVYGNDQYGYFSTSHIERRKGEQFVELVPPGYRFPLKFFVKGQGKHGDEVRTLPSAAWSSPVPPLLAASVKITTQTTAPIAASERKFAANFFLLDGAVASRLIESKELAVATVTVAHRVRLVDERRRQIYVFIVNQFGEIVWMHAPASGRRAFDSYAIAKPLGLGRYAVMTAQKESYFETLDFRGQTIETLEPKSAPLPFMINHDFALTPNGSLVTLGNSTGYFREPKSPWSAPASYMGSTLLATNLATGKVEQLWDSFDNFTPFNVTNRGEDGLRADKYQSVWNGPELTYDFVHANSLDHAAGVGILISLKNLDKLVMLDERGKKVLWTVGVGAENTFRVAAADAFHNQHHATWLGSDRILVVDNGLSVTRVIELKLDNATHAANVVKQFSADPPLFAATRGSAYLEKGGRRLTAFFVGRDSEREPTESHIVEFDYATGRELARMNFAYDVHHVGYRAVPLDTIGEEKYVGPGIAGALGQAH